MKPKIKHLHAILISLLTLIPFPLAMAQNSQIVPFELFPLQPNNTIVASYNFSDHPIIYCYESTFQFLGIMQWTFNGKLSSPIGLGQFSITTNPASFEGEAADPTGTIVITNNTNPPIIIFVSCQFGF